MAEKSTVSLSEAMHFCGTPAELALYLDKLADSMVFVSDSDEVYEDAPQSVSFRTTQRERETFDAYMYELSMIPELSHDELNRAFLSADENMRQALAENALHLVPDIAGIYAKPLNVDVLQAGNVGLLEAVAEYDSTVHDFDFVPYAVFRIRHSILDFLAETVRLRRGDRSLREKSDEAARVFYRMKSSLGRVPTADELAGECGIDESIASSVIEQLKNAPKRSGHTENSDSGAERTAELLSQLTEKEAAVIRMLYGLDGSENTLREAAQKLHMTEDEVQSLASSAMDKLRKNN